MLGSVLAELVEARMRFIQPLNLAQQLLTISLTIGEANGLFGPLIGSPLSSINPWLDQPAFAQSGGRTRGGSFDRPSPSQAPSYSPPRSDDYLDPYDYSRPRNTPSYPYQPDYFPGSYRRPPVIVLPPQSYPVPRDPYGYGTGGYSTSGSGDSFFLVLVLVCGFCMLPVLMTYLRQANNRSAAASNGANEINNDIVTVTQLQVGLLAQARYIQTELTQLSLSANLDTLEGLTRLLQETVLALLRSPENWSHARITSQTVQSRSQAGQLFEQLSIQTRSKLSAETLVNVGGQIRQQAISVNPDAEPASYIVVTLLLGTADDRAIANSIHSVQELRTILERLGGLTPDYLMVFELIWSPQDASDSLSREQMLSLYPDLMQIA